MILVTEEILLAGWVYARLKLSVCPGASVKGKPVKVTTPVPAS